MATVEAYGSIPEGSRKVDVYWAFSDVEERLIEAFTFLDKVVGSGRWPYAGDGPWHLVVRDNRAGAQVDGDTADYVEPESDRDIMRRRGLRAHEVTRMEETLDWVRHLPEKRQVRALVGVVIWQKVNGGSQVDWAQVKRRLASGDTHDVLRKTYSRSITRLAQALTRLRVPVSR